MIVTHALLNIYFRITENIFFISRFNANIRSLFHYTRYKIVHSCVQKADVQILEIFLIQITV
jgi:hypothetical protein